MAAVTITGLIVGLMVAAFRTKEPAHPVTNPSLEGGLPSSHADPRVQQILDEQFNGPCVTSATATRELNYSLHEAGFDEWQVTSRAEESDCVAGGLDPSTSTIILFTVQGPGVTEAMNGVRADLMDRCLGRTEAIEYISSVLQSAGVEDFEVRTDGPFAFPLADQDAVRAHVADGCYVYSLSGHSAGGTPTYYLSGPEAEGTESSPAPTIEEIVDGDSLTGAALADALGLRLEPGPGVFGPCQAWFGVSEEGGYCLDGLSPYKDHLYVIGQALKGVDLNDEQLQSIEEMLHRNADEGDQFALTARGRARH
jgi:hypothetical protein